MGRPRTSTPPDPELEILGQELVDWATYADTEKPKKDDKRIHLKQWYSLVKGLTKKNWDHMCEKEIFRAYYEKAQAAISIRYIDGTVNPSIAQRFLRLYFSELKKDEDQVVEMKARLKNLDPEAVETIINIVNYSNQKNNIKPECEK